ncbi:MAG: outer membrane protein assembly factor BamB [Comamonadaceae bacterium CG_4_9_14_3_um_filter_60_33]|nr:MAG: outer membrane protein assembly factor BamB [Comamonadaceae bacterium CG2_30_59_20]PJB46277.1 MAG: outer membrane protein assembly factor BamB [Comamonadaceae bacterium CG_4_9_14_3_um_filter_60_33]
MAKYFSVGSLRPLLAVVLAAALSACSSGPDQIKPAELGANPALLGVRTAWNSKIAPVDFPLQIKVDGAAVTLAGADGVVQSLNARTGVSLWRVSVGAPISAGVGSDGRFAAVVTRANELVVLEAGQILWRARLPAQVFTAPLVAGERVFVLAADRGVTAFDARSGRKLWQQQRPGEALVLRQAGILMPMGNTLVAGLAGHLVGMNPLNGNVVWDAALASPRGTNDIERLVDLVGGVSRQGDEVCARAFQSAVGCIDTQRGSVIWKRPAVGNMGLQGDESQVYGVESDGTLLAWRRSDGEPVWTSERLRYRTLSAPLVLGRSVVLGDATGLVHFVSRTDGSLLTRLSTDGSAIAVTPVVAADTLVVVTRNGGVYGFQPE